MADPYSYVSALAALLSTGIAAYLVIQGKRESPDISLIPMPISVSQGTLITRGGMLPQSHKLLFQNAGARAGSLITVELVCPPSNANGYFYAELTPVKLLELDLPRVLQPYTAEIVYIDITFHGEPNVRALLNGLGDKARIEVRYQVTTKKKMPETRTGYVEFKITG